MADGFIEFRNISKAFAGVQALAEVSLDIQAGECHALMGENGAGKSTLGKCLAGVHRPTAGEIRVAGRTVRIHTPADAAREGIGMVHQELAFCPNLSVAENLCLGHYPRMAGMFLSRRAMRRRARELLAKIGVDLDVSVPMRELSTAQEQVVQIASAIGTGARILIFDEPTASLSEREARQLFALIEDLKKRSVTILYVSHRMPEVFRLCDAISVLRDGRYVGTVRREAGASWPEGTQDQVVQMMIGRSVAEYMPAYAVAPSDQVLLQVKHLSSPGRFEDVSFSVRAGEIVGLAGLVGAGRSEVARAIFGLDADATGEVLVAGERLRGGSIRDAMRRGVGLVPEDRKRQGLVLMMGGRQNFSLPLLRRLNHLGFLRFGEERRMAGDFFARLHVKTSSLSAPVSSMSGGNQQKVVIAKWLARGGKILIVDEPTRGVDVGAKAAIHHLLDELASTGVAILLISSELREVLGISSRVLVVREGGLVGEMPRAQATQEKAIRLMAGVWCSEVRSTGFSMKDGRLKPVLRTCVLAQCVHAHPIFNANTGPPRAHRGPGRLADRDGARHQKRRPSRHLRRPFRTGAHRRTSPAVRHDKNRRPASNRPVDPHAQASRMHPGRHGRPRRQNRNVPAIPPVPLRPRLARGTHLVLPPQARQAQQHASQRAGR